MDQQVALSVKQPWATLIAFGVKTVEVRTWRTDRRGTVLLHTGRTPDTRPHAWKLLATEEMHRAARQCGGIVATMELAGCIDYPDRRLFAEDVPRHWNRPDWFRPPGMHGFVLADVRRTTFVPCRGNLFFFPPRIENVHPLLGESTNIEGEMG